MAPLGTRPSFPHSQSLPSGSFHTLLILIHQSADTMKTTITETNQIDHMDQTLSNSMKLWAMPRRANQDGWVMVESSDKMWSTGQGMANYFSTFALRSPWRVWKGKKIWPHPSLHNFHMKVRPDQGISSHLTESLHHLLFTPSSLSLPQFPSAFLSSCNTI